MNKAFASALVCTATFATKVNQIEAEVISYDIWKEDLLNVCHQDENDLETWFRAADTDNNNLISY